MLLRLFELQTSEPQPTCTRSRAVKRLLAAVFAASKEVAAAALACLERLVCCCLGRLSFSLFLLEEADGSLCPVGGLVFVVGAGADLPRVGFGLDCGAYWGQGWVERWRGGMGGIGVFWRC